MKEASRGYKGSLGFPECKDPRGRTDRRDRRATRESQDCQEPKGPEDRQEHRVTLETQDFLVFLAKMVPQVPLGSQDAMEQREREGSWGLRACLGSPDTPDHQDCQE